jgi:lipopolysaccharide transport system ATP-binding protein
MMSSDMTESVIRVENVSKRYRIGLKDQTHSTLRGAMLSVIKQPVKNLRYLRGLTSFSDDEGNNNDILWALKDISFEVFPGQVIGIVGSNGAGKSTLLKIIAGIARPTSGRIETRGRVSCLLGIGAGLNPELTGHDNIFVNGIMLGMSRTEVKRKYDEIVAFSGIEKFLYTPFKRYSSGMRGRLAFSVAAHLEPEILILDEVLAAGDVEFRTKSKAKMKEIISQGCTVVMVSHMLGIIQQLSHRCLWLSHGHIMADGNPDYVITQYKNSVNVSSAEVSAQEDQ